jgi:hypothetical protein
MATIFPLSASAGQQFDGYAFDGESWNILGENWKPFIYSATEPDFHEAGFIWVNSNEVVEEVTYATASGYQILTNKVLNGDNNSFSNIPESATLPDQDGNSGKFLTTSGSVSSWGTVDIVGAINTASAAAVTYLVDSAPGSLDTLNELAAALNDDANFSSTVTTSLGNKLDASSASTTYLTQSSASTNYLTQSSASTAYLTQSNASATYLTISNPVITGVTSINAIEESVTLAATSASGTVVYDVLSNNAITFYTSNASANWTLNIRGNSGTTLNSMLNTGQSLTIAFAVTNGATAYYQTALQVDGSAITPKWQGGSSPTSGNTNSIDVYSITIIKTGNAAFTVWESQTRFA